MSSATETASAVTLSAAEEERYAELQQMALGFARNGETGCLLSMLDAGLPINLSDHKGNSLLMLASYNGHVDTARMLLGRGADVDRRNDHGQTPLGGVAFKGQVDLVELLLQHGADVNANNGMGMTPVMFAAMFGRKEVVRFLNSRASSGGVSGQGGLKSRFLLWASKVSAMVLRRR